jgi:pyrimidine operon attenuation protein/uracil phosphoribosyltransferase
MSITSLLDASEMTRMLERLASQILERHAGCDNVMLVGIQRRGADLARRLASLLEERLGHAISLGTLDINLYRDDWTSLAGNTPHVGQSRIDDSVDDRIIILVDDVLYTGRTIRAALEALLDYGRPSAVELLTLIDRGHRELPIHADYVGRTVNTSRQEHVDVLLTERDGKDAVQLVSKQMQQQ